MKIVLDTGLKVKTIGDPHLGRNFSVGTPLTRKGDREEGQLAQFSLELMDQDCNVNIMMGDIFDKFIVDPTIVMATYQLYSHAAITNPQIDYVILRGNHDISRDQNRFSSFDLLCHMLSGIRNIIIIQDFGIYTSRDSTTNLLLNGYNCFATTEEMCEGANLEQFGYVHGAFGHWDIESYGGDDHNLCPYVYLSQFTDLIVTGHIHTPSEFYIHAETGEKITKDLIALHPYTKVVVTGSMQPYTHGEDPDELIYVTRTLKEYEEEVEVDPKVYHNKCLRLLIKPEEDLPEDLDVLQFQYKIIREGNSEDPIQVDLMNFNFSELFKETLKAHDVDDEYIETMWDTYKELADVEDD